MTWFVLVADSWLCPVLGVALKECAAGKDLLAWDVTEPLVETHFLNAPGARVTNVYWHGNGRLKIVFISFFPIKDYKADPVSYECQWSGDWSPIPGCAIEVDISYSGINLNQADAKGADRQKDAHACQALCRSRNNTYFKWVSPEFNQTLDPSAVPFSCFCKNDITARKMKPGSISGAGTAFKLS